MEQNIATMIVGLREFGIERYRAVKIGHCSIDVSEVVSQRAAIVVDFNDILIKGQCFIVIAQSLFIVALGASSSAEACIRPTTGVRSRMNSEAAGITPWQ